MELFDLSPDQLNAIALIISKDFSTKYNVEQLNLIGNFFVSLGSSVLVYGASYDYYKSIQEKK